MDDGPIVPNLALGGLGSRPSRPSKVVPPLGAPVAAPAMLPAPTVPPAGSLAPLPSAHSVASALKPVVAPGGSSPAVVAPNTGIAMPLGGLARPPRVSKPAPIVAPDTSEVLVPSFSPPPPGDHRSSFSANSRILMDGVLMKFRSTKAKTAEGKGDDAEDKFASAKPWHKRYFQVRDGFLLWFPQQGDVQPCGWIRIREIKSVRVLDPRVVVPGVDDGNRNRTFEVRSLNRTLLLRAPAVDEMRQWMAKLVDGQCLTPAVKSNSGAGGSFLPSLGGAKAAGPKEGTQVLLIEGRGDDDDDQPATGVEVSLPPARALPHMNSRQRAGQERESRDSSRHRRKSSRSRSRSRTRPEDGSSGAPDRAASSRSRHRSHSRSRSASRSASTPAMVESASTASLRAASDNLDDTGKLVDGKVGDDDYVDDFEVEDITFAAAASAAAAKVVTVRSPPPIDDEASKWVPHWDAQNMRTIFVNKETHETTDRPPMVGADAEWCKYYDQDGKRAYYFNNKTGETTYEKPADFDDAHGAHRSWGWGGWYSDDPQPTEGSRPAPAQASADPDTTAVSPPSEWLECWDETYKAPYYINTQTNASQWERPEGPNVHITQYSAHRNADDEVGEELQTDAAAGAEEPQQMVSDPRHK